MKLVKQKPNACVPTAIFMLNDNKDYRKIKNLCKKRFGYRHSKKDGCCVNDDVMLTLLNQLGMQASSIEEGVLYRTFSELSGYSRGLIMIQHGTENTGHCVAWDGYRVFDPLHDKILPECEIFKTYGSDIRCSFYKVKTTMWVRLANVLKKPFFELRCKCESICS